MSVKYDVITIEEINSALIATVATQLQNYIQRRLRKEYDADYILCEFFPKSAQELTDLFALEGALRQAEYIPALFGMACKDAEVTPYYLKIQWPPMQIN
jgi:hypothetical protein